MYIQTHQQDVTGQKNKKTEDKKKKIMYELNGCQPLILSSAEPKNITALIAKHSESWVFGKPSCEVAQSRSSQKNNRYTTMQLSLNIAIATEDKIISNISFRPGMIHLERFSNLK